MPRIRVATGTKIDGPIALAGGTKCQLYKALWLGRTTMPIKSRIGRSLPSPKTLHYGSTSIARRTRPTRSSLQQPHSLRQMAVRRQFILGRGDQAGYMLFDL